MKLAQISYPGQLPYLHTRLVLTRESLANFLSRSCVNKMVYKYALPPMHVTSCNGHCSCHTCDGFVLDLLNQRLMTLQHGNTADLFKLFNV